MAKKKGKNKNNAGIPVELQEKILRTSPTELAIELSFEENAIDALRGQAKNDVQVKDLAEDVKKLQEALNQKDEVIKAKEAYDNVVAEHTSEELLEAKENLAALRKGYQNDLKDRSKKLKFIKKTLKSHIESGALKRKG